MSEANTNYISYLIELSKEGRKNSFLELCKLNASNIYALVARLLGEKELAIQISTEIFISAWGNLAHFREEVNFSDWLKAISVYSVMEEIRTGVKRKEIKKESKLTSKEIESLNNLEKLIFELPDDERVIFVLNQLNGYSLDEVSEFLPAIPKQEIETKFYLAAEKLNNSLLGYEDEKNEFEVLNDAVFDLLERGTGVHVPEKVLEGLYNALMKLSEEKAGIKSRTFNKNQLDEIRKSIRKQIGKSKEKVQKSSGVKHVQAVKNVAAANKKLLYSLFGIICIFALGYMFFYYALFNAPWKIKVVKGFYKINNVIDYAMLFNKGDVLSTDDSSAVAINVPGIGRVEVSTASEVELIAARNDGNIISLRKGNIKVESHLLLPRFRVVTPMLTIIDEGGDFSVSIESDKNEIVEVTSGSLRIEAPNISFPLLENYQCKIIEGNLFGTPHRSEMSEFMDQKLEEIDFGGGGVESLSALLIGVTEEDALMLWVLLKKVPLQDKYIIYEKLYNFFPPPEGVTRSGIFNLDSEMFDLWWDEIEWQL